ncbi:hypothetical protein TEQG_07552 [Trichophyton equinum CBS 127.97]|uniref:SUZ domain-containing protein n=1 Tax=Trichophyton equinum (strain ATCC MYA-4606 / CBS 127.97) TaxID=559882 RepID=F2Q3B7_TRIEC|nr:hypothetical protein TEQG_07552 [Trichophyton equinum CBS 127.97]
MNRTDQIPDAWDADWESIADKPSQAPEPVPEKKLSARAAKAQRRAEHAEFNRQLWAEADTPQTFHFLESRSTVPLKSEYKVPMKVLARKPQSNRSGLESGIQGLSVQDQGQGDADDDEDFERKPGQLTYEERVAKAQKEREEKQRKYEEVRERLFGSSTPGSGASSPGNGGTPPRQGQHQGGEGKKRGRNNRSNTGGNRENKERRDRDNANASPKTQGRLFDPNYSPRTNSSYVQRKEKERAVGEFSREAPSQPQLDMQSQSPQLQAPIRSPRGPDSSGRGGFGGFPSRGGRG